MRLIDADALKEYIDIQEGRLFIGCTIGEALKIMTDEQPTVSQWIPCSREMPEVEKWVLVSSGDCVVSDCLVVRGGNKIWYECGRIDIEHDAWMPLPEPYKEDRQ